MVHLETPSIIMIQWQWVITAFLAGITLTLFLEIRRRRKLNKASSGFYVFPIISLLLAIGMGLLSLSPVISEETAVIHPIASLTPTPATTHLQQKSLPAPQILLQETQPIPAVNPEPTSAPPETAVRQLIIPALNLSKPVHTIPLQNGIWNVAELGSDVGWLETTAVHPDDEQAMVFVGHMTFAHNKLLEQGAFANIPTLSYDTPIILETEIGSHTYFVDSVRRVSPNDIDALYQEPGNTILLLTCADWNAQQGIYENRLLVRASKE